LEHIPLRNTPLLAGIILDSNMMDSEKRQMVINHIGQFSDASCGATWRPTPTCPSQCPYSPTSSGIDHWNALMHVVGYVWNTIDYGLTYSCKGDLSPLRYTDTDYGGCCDTCWSTSGYVFMIAGGPVTWSSKQQSISNRVWWHY
jgi:hypothetical protein